MGSAARSFMQVRSHPSAVLPQGKDLADAALSQYRLHPCPPRPQVPQASASGMRCDANRPHTGAPQMATLAARKEDEDEDKDEEGVGVGLGVGGGVGGCLAFKGCIK